MLQQIALEFLGKIQNKVGVERSSFGDREQIILYIRILRLLRSAGLPFELVKWSLCRAQSLVEPHQGEIRINPGLSGGAGHLQHAVLLYNQLSFHLGLFCFCIENQ